MLERNELLNKNASEIAFILGQTYPKFARIGLRQQIIQEDNQVRFKDFMGCEMVVREYNGEQRDAFIKDGKLILVLSDKEENVTQFIIASDRNQFELLDKFMTLISFPSNYALKLFVNALENFKEV